MRFALVLICLGIASATFVTDVPFVLTLFLICTVVLAVSFLLIELLKASNLPRRLLIGLLLYFLGVCWHLNWASNLLRERLPETLEGETIQVEGLVIGLPKRSLIGQQFFFEIRQGPTGLFPRKVILNYYGGSTVLPGRY